MKRISGLLATAALTTAAGVMGIAEQSQAQFINFEPDAIGQFPDGSLVVDNLALSDQFSALGVTFGLDVDLDGSADPGLFPRLEAVGSSDPTHGFKNDSLDEFDVAFAEETRETIDPSRKIDDAIPVFVEYLGRRNK